MWAFLQYSVYAVGSVAFSLGILLPTIALLGLKQRIYDKTYDGLWQIMRLDMNHDDLKFGTGGGFWKGR